MSASTAIDPQALTGEGVESSDPAHHIETGEVDPVATDPDVRSAKAELRYWIAWQSVPLTVLLAAAIFRLDRLFYAVGLFCGVVLVIRLVQAWSDYDTTRRAARARRECRTSRLQTARPLALAQADAN